MSILKQTSRMSYTLSTKVAQEYGLISFLPNGLLYFDFEYLKNKINNIGKAKEYDLNASPF